MASSIVSTLSCKMCVGLVEFKIYEFVIIPLVPSKIDLWLIASFNGIVNIFSLKKVLSYLYH